MAEKWRLICLGKSSFLAKFTDVKQLTAMSYDY